MQDRDALLIVDVQNDFCPGGALPVKDGDRVVPVLNRYIKMFEKAKLPILATRDWHPEKTTHFNTYGGVWPPHCVQGTKGAEFHPDLALPAGVCVISKGMGPEEDSYSAFQGRDLAGLGLADILRGRGVERIFVGGLATDYCVKFTVLDGVKEEFEAILLVDAIRGVDLRAGDSDRAIEEMVRAGAKTMVETAIAV
ncbi:MAG: bifunctional nicotinamidase/pyrazinamidase [Candidatus Binatia bacterium]